MNLMHINKWLLQNIFILILSFHSKTAIFAQNVDCYEGTKNAKEDFEKGILRIYIFRQANPFTLIKILKEDYDIEAIYWGCDVDPKMECYSKFIFTKIKQKYGDNFFENISVKADSIDQKLGYSGPTEFPGGEIELMKFIYCNLNFANLNHSNVKNDVTVYVQFNVDTTGRVNNVTLIKGVSSDFDNEAIRIVKKMPQWIAAKQKGRPINQIFTIPIVFDKKKKESICP